MGSHASRNASATSRTTADDLHDPEFDLRDILAATSVEELSFAQFLEALQQYGKPQH
jgi:hypothetical protein